MPDIDTEFVEILRRLNANAEVVFLGHIAGAEDFDSLFERSIPTTVDDVEVRIASLDDLIAMKRAANRLKDQNHILELEALKRLKATDGGQKISTAEA